MCNTLTSLCIRLSQLELRETKQMEISHSTQGRTIDRRTYWISTEVGYHLGVVYGLTDDYANTRIPTRFWDL